MKLCGDNLDFAVLKDVFSTDSVPQTLIVTANRFTDGVVEIAFKLPDAVCAPNWLSDLMIENRLFEFTVLCSAKHRAQLNEVPAIPSWPGFALDA